jgi:hypothetical protein
MNTHAQVGAERAQQEAGSNGGGQGGADGAEGGSAAAPENNMAEKQEGMCVAGAEGAQQGDEEMAGLMQPTQSETQHQGVL